MTRARRLLVVVGQTKALYLAVGDWRRAPRHTALGGLLDGVLRFGWARPAEEADDPSSEVDTAVWQGSTEEMAS